MKKNYEKPELFSVKLESNAILQTGSNYLDNTVDGDAGVRPKRMKVFSDEWLEEEEIEL